MLKWWIWNFRRVIVWQCKLTKCVIVQLLVEKMNITTGLSGTAGNIYTIKLILKHLNTIRDLHLTLYHFNKPDLQSSDVRYKAIYGSTIFQKFAISKPNAVVLQLCCKCLPFRSMSSLWVTRWNMVCRHVCPTLPYVVTSTKIDFWRYIYINDVLKVRWLLCITWLEVLTEELMGSHIALFLCSWYLRYYWTA